MLTNCCGEAVAVIYDNENSPIIVTIDGNMVFLTQGSEVLYVVSPEDLIKALHLAKKQLKP